MMMELTLHNEFPENLEAEWNDLLLRSADNVPFMRYEYLTTWWQTRGGGEWPDASLVLVTAHKDGRLCAAAPLLHTPDHEGKPSLLLVGSIEISDYLDLLGEKDDLPEFVSQLLGFLDSDVIPEWKQVDLYNILESSPTLEVLAKASAERGWKSTLEKYKHSPFIQLPGDWEEYLAGIDKKQRHEIRRKIRRLEERADVPSRWYYVQEASQLDSEINDMLDLMEMDPAKQDFLTDAMRQQMQQTIRCAFERDCLKMFFLEIDGRKAAGILCFDYGNRLWAYNSGFDSSLNDYSPGWVLLGYVLQWANEKKYDAFDFMRGDEKYKYRFGATDRFVMRLTISR